MTGSGTQDPSSPRRDAGMSGWMEGRERVVSALDALLGERPFASWLEEYEGSHQRPLNQWLHLVGIPAFAAAFPLALLAAFLPSLRRPAAALFAFGLLAQMAGHAAEGRFPGSLRDWRFWLVGLRWWLTRVSRSA